MALHTASENSFNLRSRASLILFVMLGAHHARGYVGAETGCPVLRPKDLHVSAVGHTGLFYGAIHTLTAIVLQTEVMQA